MELNVGTNEVETFARNVCKQNVRKDRNKKLIKETMKHKVIDAEYDERCARNDFVRDSIEYSKVTNRGSWVDSEFKSVMRYEVEFEWNSSKEKNRKKIGHLVEKYAPKRVLDSAKIYQQFKDCTHQGQQL